MPRVWRALPRIWVSRRSFTRSSIQDLQHNLQKGRPVIALIPKPKYSEGINIAVNRIPLSGIWEMFAPKESHWIIVIGYTKHQLILQDPAVGRIGVSKSTFEDWWRSKKFTCVLVTAE